VFFESLTQDIITLVRKLAVKYHLNDTCIAFFTHEDIMALSIRLPSDVETRLQNLATLTGRSKTFYVTEAILEHLDDLEDLYLAEQRLLDNRAGKSKTYSLDEVERELGLAD
jgi:RHH-type rel operon transcriptional repressor/antitoxin RelB